MLGQLFIVRWNVSSARRHVLYKVHEVLYVRYNNCPLGERRLYNDLCEPLGEVHDVDVDVDGKGLDSRLKFGSKY